MFKRNARAGFTLVELMIVVAIIGILATIAIPQYQRFIGRSRQTEARVALGGAHTMLSAFQATNQSFTACLNNAGFVRDGQNFFYLVGFGANVTGAAAGCGPDGSLGCLGNQWQADAAGVWTASAACVAGNGTTHFNANSRTGNTIAIADLQAPARFDGAAVVAPAVFAEDAAAIFTEIVAGNYTVGAYGNIFGEERDAWTINQGKNLQNVINGVNGLAL